jgi:4-hydroxybenzoate polyprenyltransferase
MSVLAIPAVLLRLARLSNAPTVVSQCLAGSVLGSLAQRHDAIDWAALGRSIGIVLLTYAGGMILNDVLDEPIDRVERPDRPLPARRIGRATATAAAVACLGGALALAWSLGHPTEAKFATALVIAAVLYDVLHLFTGGTTLLLGACRGLVYLVAALGQADGPWTATARDAPVALAVLVGAYVAIFSVIARGEAERPAPEAGGWRCDRCGSRDVAGRTACDRCGQPVDATAGVGVIGHRRAEPWQRGAWLEWLGLVPLLGVFAAATASRGAGATEFAYATPAAIALVAFTFAAGHRARAGGPSVGPAVGMWIAAIPLVDATLLLALGHPWLACGAIACFVGARLLARRIAPS